MSKEQSTKKPLLYEDHPKPVTRRQFLAQGLIDGATYLMLPSVASQILKSTPALAAECASSTISELTPFLLFDCAGGAALAGNWVVGNQGGPTDFLPAYDRMGVATPPQAGEVIDTSMGVPMYTNLSQVRAGMVATASPEALANLRMGTICTASQDDTGSNELSPLVLISKAAGSGRHIHTGVGSRSSFSGGNSQGPVTDAALKPLAVSSVNSVLGALSFGPALDTLSLTQRASVANAISRLSDAQAARLSRMSLGDEFKTLVQCGLIRNQSYVDKSVATNDVDPRLNTDVQTIYGITAASTGGVTAIPSIVYNVLKKNTGPGVIVFGGCDYHDGTQTTGDAKDLEIGQAIGRAIELAKRLGTPLFFAVVSDGAVYSDIGTRVWRGDAGSQGLLVVGYYNPAGAPSQVRQQVGHFRTGQGVERNTYIGNSPSRAAMAVFANYLAACGRLGMFSNWISDRDFETSRIDAHMIFG